MAGVDQVRDGRTRAVTPRRRRARSGSPRGDRRRGREATRGRPPWSRPTWMEPRALSAHPPVIRERGGSLVRAPSACGVWQDRTATSAGGRGQGGIMGTDFVPPAALIEPRAAPCGPRFSPAACRRPRRYGSQRVDRAIGFSGRAPQPPSGFGTSWRWEQPGEQAGRPSEVDAARRPPDSTEAASARACRGSCRGSRCRPPLHPSHCARRRHA